jgi:hypothetical protein
MLTPDELNRLNQIRLYGGPHGRGFSYRALADAIGIAYPHLHQILNTPAHRLNLFNRTEARLRSFLAKHAQGRRRRDDVRQDDVRQQTS